MADPTPGDADGGPTTCPGTNCSEDVRADNDTSSGYSQATLHQIHVVALCNLAVSSLISIVAIIYLLKIHGNKLRSKTGERVVLYLAVADLCYSSWHAADHAYVLASNNKPPPDICRVLGVLQTSFFISPCIVVLAIASNVLIVVSTHRELNFGKYDYRLLATAFVAPQLLCTVLAFFDYIGTNGTWCGFNTSVVGGRVLTQINAIFTFVVFITTLLCYAWILRIVKRSSKRVFSFAENTSSSRSQRQMVAAKQRRMFRVLTAFVVAFALQYWAVTLYFTWVFFPGSPPAIMVFLTVTFTNQGGLFNCVAYIILRKRFRARSGSVALPQRFNRFNSLPTSAATSPPGLPTGGPAPGDAS